MSTVSLPLPDLPLFREENCPVPPPPKKGSFPLLVRAWPDVRRQANKSELHAPGLGRLMDSKAAQPSDSWALGARPSRLGPEPALRVAAAWPPSASSRRAPAPAAGRRRAPRAAPAAGTHGGEARPARPARERQRRLAAPRSRPVQTRSTGRSSCSPRLAMGADRVVQPLSSRRQPATFTAAPYMIETVM
jgi:hypothetical protein